MKLQVVIVVSILSHQVAIVVSTTSSLRMRYSCHFDFFNSYF